MAFAGSGAKFERLRRLQQVQVRSGLGNDPWHPDGRPAESTASLWESNALLS